VAAADNQPVGDFRMPGAEHGGPCGQYGLMTESCVLTICPESLRRSKQETCTDSEKRINCCGRRLKLVYSVCVSSL